MALMEGAAWREQFTEELRNKFMSLSTDLVPSGQAETIWETGMRIDELDDVSEFTALLVAG